MQDKSALGDQGSLQEQAFEYVVGTLSDVERQQFEARMLADPQLEQTVHEWEEQLIGLTHDVAPIPPKPATFQNIQNRLGHGQVVAESNVSFWQSLGTWRWASAITFSLFLGVSVLHLSTLQQHNLRDDEPQTDQHLAEQGAPLPESGLAQDEQPVAAPNADYLAVLLDDAEQPVLTAVTASQGNTLWLKWEDWSTRPNTSLQLWAKSRRDGQIRPLLVFGQQELNEVSLDQASLRLIQDSSHLIITEEEIGGSAIDEPSEKVIAQGVCIRLKETKGKA